MRIKNLKKETMKRQLLQPNAFVSFSLLFPTYSQLSQAQILLFSQLTFHIFLII